MGAVDLQAGRVGLPFERFRMPESSLAADLSPEAVRLREFARECEIEARRLEAKARKVRERAMRLPLNSNGRRKKLAEADRIEIQAGLMLAASRGGN